MNAKKPTRQALGRGLSALISSAPVPVVPVVPFIAANRNDAVVEVESRRVEEASNAVTAIQPEPQEPAAETSLTGLQYLPIEKIVANPFQPRQDFKETEIRELSESIKSLGVLQPILVRRAPEGQFQIVAGERRWRAAKLAGLTQVPVITSEMDEKQALEIAVVENVQRQDLNPVEEALAYQRLAIEFKLTQVEIAERVGKDRASVANYLRLLNLPDTILQSMREEKLSMGHAKALLTIKEPAAQISLAKKVLKENLSVRALETIVSRVVVLDYGKPSQRKAGGRASSEESFPEAADRLRNALGTKVIIKHQNTGRGRIEVEYFSEQELDRLVEILSRPSI